MAAPASSRTASRGLTALSVLLLVVGVIVVGPISPRAGAADPVWEWRVEERVSVASDGSQSNFSSGSPSVSTDGRYIAFQSDASNLVADDTNGAGDVFVHDRTTGATQRVSITTGGTEANSLSGNPAISADGRYVAFESEASNLVADDTNGWTWDVFVHDRTTGATERVSIATGGTEADGGSYEPAISADGRYVAFESFASNLVAGDSAFGSGDVFVHDRTTGTTERVSIATDSTPGNGNSGSPVISDDGRYIAFQSEASNLVADDTNASSDVFVHDRTTGATQRVSIATDSTPGNGNSVSPSISGDGRYVAFESEASNLVADDTNATRDVFVHDRTIGTTQRVSITTNAIQASQDSRSPVISDDGRYVAFQSEASDLVAGDTNGNRDVFVHDRTTGTTERVSNATDGTQGNGNSYNPAISADGDSVAFGSVASNLVADDTNVIADVFAAIRVFDITDPVVVITTPVDAGSYELDAVVAADYGCSDAGSGIASCVGTVADGDPIDTSTLGEHSFTVTATDNAFNTTTLTHTYTVVEVTDPSVIRHAGSNRFGTAAAIAQGDFPTPVDTVFVAVGSNFPDALAGAAVAGKDGAPLLLANTTSIPADTIDQLVRLDPDTIVILGGTSVISPGVETALGAYAPTVVRLAGSNRYATAVEISKYGFPAGAAEVFVATGTGFADALAAGPAAAVLGGPVLLTAPDALPQVVAAEITRLAPDRIVVVGGTAAVSAAVFAQLQAIQPNTVRLSGTNRYETTVAISVDAFAGGAERVYVATGLNFPDALAGAAAAGWYTSPIMLVPGTSIPTVVSDEITRLAPTTIIVLGGTTVVSTGVEDQLEALLP